MTGKAGKKARTGVMKNSISILLVDDERIMRDRLKKILVREGYRILTAEDGVMACSILEKQHIDIVVSDMKMPRMNGFELLEFLKREHPSIGVIIMTAYGDTYTVKDALLLGADEYITKPFKSYEISLVVERAYWRILSQTDETSEELKEVSTDV